MPSIMRRQDSAVIQLSNNRLAIRALCQKQGRPDPVFIELVANGEVIASGANQIVKPLEGDGELVCYLRCLDDDRQFDFDAHLFVSFIDADNLQVTVDLPAIEAAGLERVEIARLTRLRAGCQVERSVDNADRAAKEKAVGGLKQLVKSVINRRRAEGKPNPQCTRTVVLDQSVSMQALGPQLRALGETIAAITGGEVQESEAEANAVVGIPPMPSDAVFITDLPVHSAGNVATFALCDDSMKVHFAQTPNVLCVDNTAPEVLISIANGKRDGVQSAERTIEAFIEFLQRLES